tara:strand:+ start:809 stop:1018 length:210 start_codon:yes stop_codon:yes gene_type:complete
MTNEPVIFMVTDSSKPADRAPDFYWAWGEGETSATIRAEFVAAQGRPFKVRRATERETRDASSLDFSGE